MADDIDYPRLTAETLETIRARMTARVNAGIDPGSPLFLDAILGSIWADLSGPLALELDEYFDFANEVARAILPATTYGQWLDGWAASVGIARKEQSAAGGIERFTGPDGIDIVAGMNLSTVAAAADAEPVTFQVTASGTIAGGFVDLPVEALLPGSSGNVPAATVTEPAIEIAGVTMSNPAPMTAGADVETDDALRGRLLLELSGEQGAGTQADYRRWGLEDPGVGFVTVEPNWAGPGTVRMFLTDPSNDPVPPQVIARVKARVDPVDGQGLGLAPIGAVVTPATPAATAVDVTAALTYEPGYSVDGSSGTIALADKVEAAIRAYIDGLPVGADVVRNKVIGAIVEVVGVADTAAPHLNGSTVGDLAIASGFVAFSDDVTIS